MDRRGVAGGLRAVLALLWLLGAAAAGAAEAAALLDAPGTSDPAALLDASGAARHVEGWPEVSAVARARAEARLDPEAAALLAREVTHAFDRARLVAALDAAPGLGGPDSAALAHGFVESGATGLLGPTGGYDVASLRDLPRFASSLSAGSVPPMRLLLVARVEESTGYARNAWQTSVAVAHAFARGARLLACDGGAVPAAWDAPVSGYEAGALRERIQPFRERVRVELLFDARERSGSELQRALRFLESERVRAFHAQLREAVDDVLRSALEGLRARLEAQAEGARARCVR